MFLIAAFRALARAHASYTSLKAFAILFETARLFAMAAFVMTARVRSARLKRDLRAKRGRISLECHINCFEALIIILWVVVAALAVAAEAVLPRGEALTVELQASRVAAVALASPLLPRLPPLAVARDAAPRALAEERVHPRRA
mmetsp:Transcript_21225/g.64742  ORF Transcript_21225/g.64742 Transcript_21225/m.64742 type:complete len:144 (+) Transcript_21225:938-1369(+)